MSRSFVKIVKMSCGVAHVSTNSYVIKRIQRIPTRIEIFLGYFSIRAQMSATSVQMAEVDL
jgi:hypothetical protein